MEPYRSGRPRHPDVLTPAEWRVLEALRDGGTNAEIAARLDIGAETVKSHISNMLAKLELRDRRALAAWRPDGERGRLSAVFATLWSLGRPLAWVGVGTAALVGVAVVVTALVVLEAVMERDGDAPAAVAQPPATTATTATTATPTATPSVSPTPTATPEPPPSATPAAPPPAPGSCATPNDPTCIVAVYRGAPGDYAQVADIPADRLLTPSTSGQYHVERGQQYTVVTAAQLPEGWTRFYLDRATATPSPVSSAQLIKPIGTTYTFTVSEDDAAPARFTFDLTAARPHPLRPGLKPILGDTVVTTVFQAPKFTYNRFDTTGAATAAGSYAFLMPDADSETAGATTTVTTYEQLRTESTVLRVNVTNADGVSLGGFYDSVEVDEVVEWRKANDCFTRYAVTSTPEPTTGYREFGVEPIAYAFTGCSGAITTNASVSANWGDLPNLGGTSLTAPIVQGPFQLVPAGWTGATKAVGPRFPAGPTIPSVWTTSLAEARTFPHWREPDLPEGWSFTDAVSGDEADVGYFRAFYDGLRLIISAYGITAKFWQEEASATYRNGSQTSVRETLQIAGRPAQVHYSITERQFRVTVEVWDEATGVLYMLRGSPDMATLIAFAESMFE